MNQDVAFRKARSPDLQSARWHGFAPGRTVIKGGTQLSEGSRVVPSDILFDRDVEIKLRDGTVIYCDVYRPVVDHKVPAIAVLGPYGKQGGYWNYDLLPGNSGVAASAVSGLEKFEGPDPAFFCDHGYAVVNVDARGAFASGGDIQMFSPQENEDNYDVVEAIAAFDWCTGKIGTSGNSWLAITQWMLAAIKPPHLAAIAPWEGFTDMYRDMVCRGGIPAPDFLETVMVNLYGRNDFEDISEMLRRYPLMSDYWRTKQFDASLIDVPAYVVASYTNTLHVRGTLDAFTKLKAEKSWLRVNGTHEWRDLYEYEADLLKFFDATLKGLDNGWADTPRVRLAVLDPGGTDIIDRPETAWPLESAKPTIFYLHAEDASLSKAAATSEAETSYDAKTGYATFTYEVSGELEIVGPSRVRIWAQTDGATDMDLYVQIQKVSADGAVLLSESLPETFVPVATGRLRASHRELDEERSTPMVPVHKHEREQLLEKDQIVALDIPMWPAGIRFHKGEKLQLVISGHDRRSRYLGQAPSSGRNEGVHRILTGGRYDAHLVLPVTQSE